MKTTSKQDRQGARTPADLEQRYGFGNYGKSFAEIMGVATDARETAEKTAEQAKGIFATDIVMTGTFTNTTEAYLVPGDEEIATIQAHILGTAIIPNDLLPFYDFNNDGVVDSRDALRARRFQLGVNSFEDWPRAEKSTVTMTIDMKNPDKAIHFTGTNMWGREVDGYLGVNFTSARNPKTEEQIEALEAKMLAQEERIRVLEEWVIAFDSGTV